MIDSSQRSVSIVVAVLNRAATLQRCIDSVVEQSHRPLELIVLDGGSTDGSVAILEANSDRIAYWRSAHDRGVPHAWNTALEYAAGDWIGFLGADDRFAHPDAVARMLAAIDDDRVNYVSGQAALVDGHGMVTQVRGARCEWRTMRSYQRVAHPGSLHRRDLFERYGNFDERYPIAFDYEFLLRVGRGIRGVFVAEPVTFMAISGQSNAQAWRAFRENHQIQAAHPEIGSAAATVNHVLAGAKHLARTMAPSLMRQLQLAFR